MNVEDIFDQFEIFLEEVVLLIVFLEVVQDKEIKGLIKIVVTIQEIALGVEKKIKVKRLITARCNI